MPKQTFFNLPEEKRQAFLHYALEEFSASPYALASLSRVVARAGIAKGSFYQYFQDKKDLFLYLLDYAVQTQLAFLHDQQPSAEQYDFFALLRWQMSASIRVGLAYPRLVQLMHRAFYGEHPFHDEVAARVGATVQGALHSLILLGIEQGAIDPTIDRDLATFFVSTVLTEFRQFLWPRLGLTPDQSLEKSLQQIHPEIVEPLYDQVIRLLRDGLRNRSEAAFTSQENVL